MKQTTRYIAKQLVMSGMLVTFVMTGVIWLFVAVRAVESIVNRGLTVKLFFLLTSLQLPNFLTQILPISLFIAVLFVYTRLISDREIVVMRAAGQSPISLAKPAILISLSVMLVVYFLTLWATPTSYKTFRNLQWDIRYSLAHIVLKEGVFNVFSDSITVYLRERSSRNELKGLLVHDSRDKNRPVTYHAESGTLVETEDGAKVILVRGNSIYIDKKNPQLGRVVFFDRHTLDLTNIVNKPEIRFREARERGVLELLALRKSDVSNPKDYGKFVVEGHHRLAMPLTVLSFALIALVTLLRGDLSRRGQLKRVMGAVLIFVTLMSISLGLINICAKQLNLIPSIYIVNALPIIVAYILLAFPGRIGNKKRHWRSSVPTRTT